jgi:hypothetical protein
MELPEHLQRIRRPIPAPALHLARRAFRMYGTATSGSRRMPDFLIIGAKKAGTSSLMNWLVVHPAVVRPFPRMQRLKSPHYFDINYWRGPRWYRSHFAGERCRKRQARRNQVETVAGEASPYYMFHPAVPYRVAADLPDVRIIVSLRDPVSRAYSNYWDRKANGTETLSTFEEAIAAEPGRLATVDDQRLRSDPRYYSAHHDNHTYLARGRYVEHLPAWLELFSSSQIMVMRAESLFEDPVAAFADVQRFLDIPVVETQSLRPFNQRSRPPINAETRAMLADYYRPYNAALYEAIGRDLGWEDNYPS